MQGEANSEKASQWVPEPAKDVVAAETDPG